MSRCASHYRREVGVEPWIVRSSGGGLGRTNVESPERFRGPVGRARDGDVCAEEFPLSFVVVRSRGKGGGGGAREPNDLWDASEPERLGPGGARCFCAARSDNVLSRL